jgi:integrase
MGRKPSANLNLPVGMRARPRGRKVFYYLDKGGKPRKEIPLGADYILALKNYATLIQDIQPIGKAHFGALVERYRIEVIPAKAPCTQHDNARELIKLLEFFKDAPLDEIKPLHIAQYRDWRIEEARKRLLKSQRLAPANAGHVRANRELALFSHIWNKGREWGYTEKTNPCAGVKRHQEKGREVYVDDATYQAVWAHADRPLQDAMDLAWLTGQRPGDILRLCETDIKDGALQLSQGKTGTRLRIEITGQLAIVLTHLAARKTAHKIYPLALIYDENGAPLSQFALRSRFDRAREKAGISKQAFQFRDLRAKAATEKEQSSGMEAAKKQLGHTSETMTKRYVRNRIGALVKPTK